MSEQDDGAIPQEVQGIHRAPENNKGHLRMAHKHLLSMTAEGVDPHDWSRITAAYELVRSISEGRGFDPMLMEEWDGRAPRRYRCDTCSTVFLTRSEPTEREHRFSQHENPEYCPFCKYGTPKIVEGHDAE